MLTPETCLTHWCSLNSLTTPEVGTMMSFYDRWGNRLRKWAAWESPNSARWTEQLHTALQGINYAERCHLSIYWPRSLCRAAPTQREPTFLIWTEALRGLLRALQRESGVKARQLITPRCFTLHYLAKHASLPQRAPEQSQRALFFSLGQSRRWAWGNGESSLKDEE